MNATIVNVKAKKVTVKLQGNSLISVTPEHCYLFGICLAGLHLDEVYRQDQYVFVYHYDSVQYEVHLGRSDTCSSHRCKQLAGYCNNFYIEPTVKDELKKRSTGIRSKGQFRDLWEQPTPTAELSNFKEHWKTSSLSRILVSCSNEVGSIVSIKKKSGIVRVQGYDLEFHAKHVFLFAAPFIQKDLSVFLQSGQKVFVYVEDSQVASMWLGSNRMVTSANDIEDMKGFYYGSGISKEALEGLELQMWRLYGMSNSYDGNKTFSDLCSKPGFVDKIDRHGGVIKGKNDAWSMTFTADNVYLFAVPLEAIDDLTLFLESGQGVLVDMKDGQCATVWIGTERTIDKRDNCKALKQYCMSRNVPSNEISMLVCRHFKLIDTQQMMQEHFPGLCDVRVVEGIVIKLGKDSGQLVCRGKLLYFTRDQVFLCGYSLRNLDMSRLSTGEFDVSLGLTKNGSVDTVWIGSLNKSHSDLYEWIQNNVLEEESKRFLALHWSLPLETSTSTELQNDNLNGTELSDDLLEFWAPIADSSDEREMVVASETQKIESSPCKHYGWNDLVEIITKDQLATSESYRDHMIRRTEVACTFQTDSSNVLTEQNVLSHEWIEVPISIEQHLTLFLSKRNSVVDDREAVELATWFVDDWKHAFWDEWVISTKAAKKEEEDAESVAGSECTLVDSLYRENYPLADELVSLGISNENDDDSVDFSELKSVICSSDTLACNYNATVSQISNQIKQAVHAMEELLDKQSQTKVVLEAISSMAQQFTSVYAGNIEIFNI